jgi:hypothetical protein
MNTEEGYSWKQEITRQPVTVKGTVLKDLTPCSLVDRNIEPSGRISTQNVTPVP